MKGNKKCFYTEIRENLPQNHYQSSPKSVKRFFHINPIELRTAKTPQSFGCSSAIGLIHVV